MMSSVVVPFAEQVRKISGQLKRSFHALPISGGASLRQSQLADQYKEILGSNLQIETSVSQPFLDNLISPDSDLAYAEKLAARLFSSDATFFTTCGTTTSNFIALSALCEKEAPRVLADRNLHQSLHIRLRDIGARVDYLPSYDLDPHLGLTLTKPEDVKKMLRAAEQRGDGYELVVLNGQSYEGIVNSIPVFLKSIVDSGTALRKVLIDEAWGAANVFNPALRAHTAMAAARDPEVRAAGLCVVSTQSTHKSLSALRQASMIHVTGDARIANRIRKVRYQIHTTSASSQILASLDLARAQAQLEGRMMVQRSIGLAQSFQSIVTESNLNKHFDVVDLRDVCGTLPYVVADPTKVILKSKCLTLTGQDLRRDLFEQHGFYVSRTFSDSILFNFHIGIIENDVTELIESLEEIAKDIPVYDQGSTANDFVISYPPGVPIVVPGQKVCGAVQNRVQQERRCGARVFVI